MNLRALRLFTGENFYSSADAALREAILNAIDDVTKECLAAIPDTSISGRRVARELDAVIARRGKPDSIVSDHGTEFTSNAMLAWTQAAMLAWNLIAPGKLMQNGICEAFNGRMRQSQPTALASNG